MNSNSKYDGDYEPCKKEKKVVCNQTFVKCGAPGSVTIPLATVAGTTFTPASLTLNTSCICNPCVKIEVTSNLVAAVAFTGTLSFQVLKQCRNQFSPVPVGPAFTSDFVALLSSSTFSFFVCDCDSCDHDCCTYTLAVTVTSAVTVGTLSINNATLGAIVSSQPSLCCN